MQVVKNHPDWPNPYNGITAIRHGDIDRDVGIYLAESEQRSCALAAVSRDPRIGSLVNYSIASLRKKKQQIRRQRLTRLSFQTRVPPGTAYCARQLEVIWSSVYLIG